MKKYEEDLDLSIIKENDLENTAAFTDLMSRSERRKYKQEKQKIEDETVEFKTEDLVMQVADEKKVDDVTFKDELNSEEIIDKKKDKKKNKKIKEKKHQIEDEKKIEEELEEELSKTQKLFELTSNIDIYETKKSSSLTSVIFLSIFILALLAYYVYSILSTTFENDVYLLVNGISLLTIVLLYCVILISTKKLSKVITVIDYILIFLTIIFNVLIYIKVI